MISKIKIYGERCSGTNYLENLIQKNFIVDITSQYGFKHFFGFHNLKNSNDTLFICIVRDYFSWLNSFYQKKWHLSPTQRISTQNFIYSEHWSFYDDQRYHKKDFGKEIIEDRHIFTKNRYKNILELRYIKIQWMRKILPKLVKHFIFIRYEDLLENFQKTMVDIFLKGLVLKSPHNFPENHFEYKNSKKKFNKKKYFKISKKEIEIHPFFNVKIEKTLGYIS